MPETQLSHIRLIGGNKFSEVYERQDQQGRSFAIKQLNKHVVSATLFERILNAATSWQAISNSGLVTYHHIDRASNHINMELMEQSVRVRIREGYCDAKTVLEVLQGILFPLAYLHRRGLVHCNIKPSNVFFDIDGKIKLSDGYLYSMDNPTVLPAPRNQKYLAPEYTSANFGGITPRTDLYCVGILALELFAGDRFGKAFQGINENTRDEDHAWYQWHASSSVAPEVTSFFKSCPVELTKFVSKLVSKHPDDRFDDAEDALQNLPLNLQQTKVSTPKPASVQPSRQPAIDDVLNRPNTGIVLTIASGPRAGEMAGTDSTEVTIGSDNECFVCFPPDECPVLNAKVVCRRTPDGWIAARVRGKSIYVNQQRLRDQLPLRSGDIIRLSPLGPEVQFSLQSTGYSIKKLVTEIIALSNNQLRAAKPNKVRPATPVSTLPFPEHVDAPFEETAIVSILKQNRLSKLQSPKNWTAKQKGVVASIAGIILFVVAAAYVLSSNFGASQDATAIDAPSTLMENQEISNRDSGSSSPLDNSRPTESN